jgi:predicted house-cleaning noncanonical NTP pyrophosphatase (MazG superfamily)
MGKIPLTNAELIKALFLQEKNFGGKETANLRKVSIAKEWDNIEYAFGNEDFWWFLNKKQNEAPARIEFLFDLIRDIEKKQNPNLEDEIGTDKYATFRLFYNKFNGFNSDSNKLLEEVEKQWNTVKDYFFAFEEWYNQPVWYHYTGFLIYAGIAVVDIYNLYKNKTKDDFRQKLEDKIKDTLSVSCTESGDSCDIELTYNGDKNKIRNILLLYNIQYIVNQYTKQNEQNDGAVFIKFPFKLFKNGQWDIEHVDSFTENSVKDKNTANDWLKAAKKDFGNKIKGELLQRIDEFIERKDLVNFEDLRNKVSEIAGENNNDEKLKNSLGNLTLLDAGTNRSYGNALFPTKRRIIIEKDSTWTFIPICTKNVFLKNFTEEHASLLKWTKNDIAAYQNRIASILKEFLTVNTKK